MFAKSLLTILMLMIATKVQTIIIPTQNYCKPIEYSKEFETKYMLNNGVYDNVQYTGDIVNDWGEFVLSQGGGKSACSFDLSNMYKPKTPDKNGVYYHTVKDITYRTFMQLSHIYNYPNGDRDFYEMTEETRHIIINHFMTKASVTESEVINAFLSYVLWGSGSLTLFNRVFESENNTDVNNYLQNNGEYSTLLTCIKARRENLKHTRTWDKHGKGWSSGLAHFHRIFKHYCNN
jgi:hypothetical protein